MKKYAISLYHGILFLGFNEIGPVMQSEIFAASLFLLIGTFVTSNLFGELAGLMI